ncbi:uncharacterized protein BP01DRAFT_384754 [Aspergillus saccharolyticus JOP 1030-1]|uniref:Uncharacterized protein n=1 Tax=Aspergillus saccharolyticus JOP 1030-1 TaxID=1450539 RepID=A0A318ZH99_9EURO|nr:hypothetical protein BP01DRAFT_384754 [Aspergillus saccharolyticus JOP 1030-1]PYH43060.1 hypothetical protein BP01DRAFT_384754 [Aspergillus saccharolyticus JOP 1030-1]
MAAFQPAQTAPAQSYAVRCHSRIEWLEEPILLLDREFDLFKAPPIEQSVFRTTVSRRTPSTTPGGSAAAQPQMTLGSRAAESDPRSLALNLGMLSLYSDSRQKYYLRSSSGLFFTKLLGADNPLSPATFTSSYATQGNQIRRGLQGPSPETYCLLYNKPRKDLPSPEEATYLINIYLQGLHVDHPFLPATSLFNAYHAL